MACTLDVLMSLSWESMSLVYYGLVLLGLMAIALAIYGVAVSGWCTSQLSPSHSHRRPSRPLGESSLQPYLYSTFKYRGGVAAMDAKSHPSDCVLCLSGFEDGEDLRRLPRCMHFYHSPCIDMWLLSHSNCPLCRSPVDRPAPCGEAEASTSAEHSTEAILHIRFST